MPDEPYKSKFKELTQKALFTFKPLQGVGEPDAETDWEEWSARAETALRKSGVLDLVTGKTTRPETEALGRSDWDADDLEAKDMIRSKLGVEASHACLQKDGCGRGFVGVSCAWGRMGCLSSVKFEIQVDTKRQGEGDVQDQGVKRGGGGNGRPLSGTRARVA